MCIVRRLHEGGIHPFANAETDVHHICPILKRPADCTRPGPSRLSFTPKPRPKQCVGELEIPGLPSTTRTLFSGLRVSTHGKQAGPLVGFYHSAGRQPANSTPRPAGGGVTEEEIVSNLASQHVTAARRITVFRDNVKRNTNTIVLTFNTSILPKWLKV